ESADLLVLVVDGREGLVPGDRDIAQVVRAANTPSILAINKTDDKRSKAGRLEFYQLGFDQVFEISAEHGEGTGDLLDAIVEAVAKSQGTTQGTRPYAQGPTDAGSAEVGIAVVGRPNAGKSSLVNRLLREER